MVQNIQILPLREERFAEAVDVVLRAELDTKEEIEHHLRDVDAHYIAVRNNKIIGVIGWYQDTVHYATEAMGEKFPGADAYWVGFFAVDTDYRGKGVGYTLFTRLEKEIKKKGAKELWVSSVPETRFYYQRQGFTIIMTGKINGNTKFFMEKKLENR